MTDPSLKQVPAAGTLETAPPSPPSPAGRLVHVDALRGFALLGILIVNITYFATAYPWHGVDDPAFSSTLDKGVRLTVALLFELKFYLLFSFLFGYSFTLQLDSAVRSGSAFVPRFLRRLACLFVLGAAHAALLFHGDILTTYAVLGLILLAARRMRQRTAVIVAVVLTGWVAGSLVLAAMTGAAPAADPAAALTAGSDSTVALRAGPASIVAEHLRSMPQFLLGVASLQGPAAMAAFLVGLAAGKRRMLAHGLRRPASGLRLLMWIGYPIGIAGSAAFAAAGGTTSPDLLVLAVAVLTAPLLAAAYAATLLQACGTSWGRRVCGVLAPAGRLALTNYLGQSLACALIFTGWGFGLVGRVSPLAALLVALAIFAIQLLLSAWWLTRYQYGPVEWVLRAVTYAASPAWRRQPATAARRDQ
ncbi:MAG: DUF418 domain-containing protein [Micromonosporaceae bacterium]|nr:DUF418 domain-containing protein [Micromonosporaceae bacterium]